MIDTNKINDVSGLKNGEKSTPGIYLHYKSSPYLSIKHRSYFEVYEELLQRFQNKTVTFVEVGVLNGGSLFMWRKYFGERARIIGVDVNPGAARWKNDGFEIYIGNQADPNFWNTFFNEIGPIDILLDDGGHTYEQQIVTVHQSIPFIRDGGLIIVEDTHTSYFKRFGYPSKFTFIEWAKTLVDDLNRRFPGIGTTSRTYAQYIVSLSFFESIVSFQIDRQRCVQNAPTSNDGISLNAVDHRNQGTLIGATESLVHRLSVGRQLLNSIGPLKGPLIRIYIFLFDTLAYFYSIIRNRRLKKYY